MRELRRRSLLGAALACTASLAAEPWPSRPIHLIVAYPPGGVSDETARLLADSLSRRLKVQVLVENRAGAGGVAAMELLARAAPDGTTLCYSAISPLVFAPLLGKLGYDPLLDFQPLVSVMLTPVLLLAHPSFKPSTMAELVALARSAPGSVRWASSGAATVGHMVLEQVAQAAGVRFTHVPYKGGGQQLKEALSGEFELLSSNVAGQQIQYVRQGRLKAIAVGAPQRLAALPELPTLAEAGFPQANLVSTFGIFAPRGIAPERLALLNREFNAVLQQPEIRARMLAINNLPTGGSPEAFAQRIAQEREQAQRLLMGAAALTASGATGSMPR